MLLRDNAADVARHMATSMTKLNSWTERPSAPGQAIPALCQPLRERPRYGGIYCVDPV